MMDRLLPEDSGWPAWLLAGGLAVLTHAFVLWGYDGWLEEPEFRVAQEMHVTLVQQAKPRMASPDPVEKVQPAEALPEPEAQRPSESRPEPAFRPAMKAEKPRPSVQKKQPPAPVRVAEEVKKTLEPVKRKASTGQPLPQVREADYSADYLNNPLPHYPRAARRRGQEGLVLLRVEVLTTGRCGRIHIAKGSGHEILDDAAVVAVKRWRFIPASRAGIPVDHWMQVPIRFKLED